MVQRNCCLSRLLVYSAPTAICCQCKDPVHKYDITEKWWTFLEQTGFSRFSILQATEFPRHPAPIQLPVHHTWDDTWYYHTQHLSLSLLKCAMVLPHSYSYVSLLSFLLLAVQKSGKNLVSFTWAWCDQEMIKNFRTNRLLPLVHTTSNRRLWEGLRMRFGCILSYPSLSSDKLSDIWPHYPELI